MAEILVGRCGNGLPILTALGGLELPPKICTLPKGHKGHHSDGRAVWLNIEGHRDALERRLTSPKPQD